MASRSERKKLTAPYGRFSDDGREYVITTPTTPRPWINVVSNGDYGITVSQTGSGYSWRTHGQLNRITRWEQDLIKDEWGKYIYLKDDRGHVWSAGWKPVCREPEAYRCRHGIGYTILESSNYGVESELLIFVPTNEPLELWKLTLRNTTRRPRKVEMFTYLEWTLGTSPDWHREFHKSFIETRFDPTRHALFATKRLWEVPTDLGHWNIDWPFVAFHSSSTKPFSYDADKETFLGMYGNQRWPAAVASGKLRRRTGNWLDPVASLGIRLTLKPGEEKSVCFTLGAAESEDEAGRLIDKYRSHDAVEEAFRRVRERWDGILSTVWVTTPDPAMNVMENVWLKYQAISGRLWGRTAYYQTGGAYGFRDQLQDSQIFLPIDPQATKHQILLHARHQFKDGSVYHWWHPMTEVGHRNTISDNLLWLPFVVVAYLQETADDAVLDIPTPFVEGGSPMSLYTHCVLAIDKALSLFSDRGLPLIGGGDWNDGLSAVGLHMKGESVWLGHFLHRILLDFASVAERKADQSRADVYRARAHTLRTVINESAWDGRWYRRATKDNGEWIGAAANDEGKIYLNAQTWAVIADVAPPGRARTAMDAVKKHLECKAGTLLLYPAYTKPDRDIGYLTRYAPGMRENGGVYTHAATWSVIAAAMLGRGDDAYRFYSKINPVNRGKEADVYCAEPYVTPGNIEGPGSAFYGRGGWTWYSGSAAWLFKVGLEWILGVRPTREGLIVDPCIPASWSSFRVTRVFRGATYNIHVKNPHHVQKGVHEITLDGIPHPVDQPLPEFASGTAHEITVTMGTQTARARKS
jgi:cellobiose phosphorylase